MLARQRLANIAGIPLNQLDRHSGGGASSGGSSNLIADDAMVPIYNVTWIMPADINVHHKLVYYVQQQK